MKQKILLALGVTAIMFLCSFNYVNLHSQLSADTKADLYGFTIPQNWQVFTLVGETTPGDMAPRMYVFNPTSTATDDGENVLLMTATGSSSNPGRLIKTDMRPDWNDTNPLSSHYIVNKPTILTATGVTAGTYDYITVNSSGLVTAGYNEVTNSLSTRTLGTAYQASNTSRSYDVDITAKIAIGTSLLTANDGQITVEISANGTTGWAEYSRTQNANGGLLGSLNTQVGFLESKDIPAGYYYRFVGTQNAGSATFTLTNAHETLKR